VAGTVPIRQCRPRFEELQDGESGRGTYPLVYIKPPGRTRTHPGAIKAFSLNERFSEHLLLPVSLSPDTFCHTTRFGRRGEEEEEGEEEEDDELGTTRLCSRTMDKLSTLDMVVSTELRLVIHDRRHDASSMGVEIPRDS
jgi:hypothetical protein